MTAPRFAENAGGDVSIQRSAQNGAVIAPWILGLASMPRSTPILFERGDLTRAPRPACFSPPREVVPCPNRS